MGIILYTTVVHDGRVLMRGERGGGYLSFLQLGHVLLWYVAVVYLYVYLFVCGSICIACKHNADWTVSARTAKHGKDISYDKRIIPLHLKVMGQSSRHWLTNRFSNDSSELHFSLPAYQVMHKKTTSPTKKRTFKKINLLLWNSLMSRADNRGKSVTYHNTLCHKTIM